MDEKEQHHAEICAKLEDLSRTDADTWHEQKSEMDLLVNDIDKELRQALAYFKSVTSS